MIRHIDGVSRGQWETEICNSFPSARFENDGTWVTAIANKVGHPDIIVGVYSFVRGGGWIET